MTARTPASSEMYQYRKPVRGTLVWCLRFLGLIAFIILLLRLPRTEDVRLAHLDLRWLGFCMLLTVLQLLLEAFVWQWLLATQRIRYPYPKTALAYLASQYLGLVTPGHVGEFLAAGYISMDTGITFGYALSSVVMKKVMTWAAIVTFGAWSLPLLADVLSQNSVLPGVRHMVWTGVVVIVALSLAITVWVVSLRQLARKWQKLSPWRIDVTELRAGLRQLVSPKLLMPFAIALTAFSLLFLQFEAVLRALGISTLSLLLIAKMVALSRIAARLIPFSVAGFGSKDAAVIWLLSQHGIDPAIGLTATVLLLVCSYLVTLLLSAVCWWVKPLIVRRASLARDQS